VADVVLIGHAPVRSLLPEARARFGVELTTIDGGVSNVGEVPVARFRVGARGPQVGAALDWIGDRGAAVDVHERVVTAVARDARELAGVAA
jgi:D-methionine transport system ATP-binding protein